MGKTRRIWVQAIVAMYILWHSPSGLAQNGDFSIVHAEKITLQTIVPAPDPARISPRPPITLAFTAYGRRFELELESSNKLLNNLPVRQRSGLAAYRLFKGRISGVAGSWARITRTPSGDYGAIWDGRDLYTIAPAGTVRRALEFPFPADDSDSLIYRLSDTDSSGGQPFCTVVEPGTRKANSSPVGTSYKSLIEELQATVGATDLHGQIEVALIGDNEFVSANAADPQGALLARLNLVDEIFSEQVGITVIATELRALSGVVDPFTSTDPSSLLEQFANYRDTTPAVRSRGLAHLLTGTDLDSNTVGIAYRGSLCDPHFGVSLSEGRGSDVTTSGLIMAHELGHNFGAPHDGAAGSCSTTPQSFLMSPTLNGSGQFSSCSISEMQPKISAANCIAPATSFADASVTNTVSSVQGIAFQNVPLTLEISGTGSLPIRNARVQAVLPPNFQVISNSLPGNQCLTSGNTLNCQLGTIQPGESRQINLQLQGSETVTFSGSVTLISDNDRYAANNTQIIQFSIVQSADGEIHFDAPQYSGATRTSMDFSLTVRSEGIEPLTNAVAALYFGLMTIESISTDRGTCTASGPSANCTFGTIPNGSSFGIRVRARASNARQTSASATFGADNDRVYSNNVRGVSIDLIPTIDVALSAPVAQPHVPIDTSFSTTVVVDSKGIQAVNNLDVFVQPAGTIVVDSVISSQGNCALTGRGYMCQIGTVPAGQSRVLTITAHGTEVSSYNYILASVNSDSVDDRSDNNDAFIFPDVRRQRDIAVDFGAFTSGYDGSDFTASLMIASIGLSAVTNATFTATLPSPFIVHAASLEGASCQVSGGTATCTAASVPAGYAGYMVLTAESAQPGNYSGSVSVVSASDDYAGNNSSTISLEIRPFMDTALELVAPPVSIKVGETFPLQFKITQNRNASPSTGLFVNWDPSLEIISYSAPFQSQCEPIIGPYISCAGFSLAANSATMLTVNLRSPRRMPFYVKAFAQSISDPAYSNNEVNFTAFAERHGDASLQPASTSINVQKGAVFSLPIVKIVASAPVDEATVEIDSNNAAIAALSISSMSGNPSCATFSSGHATCTVGSLEIGESRDITITARAQGAGTTSIAFKLTSPNDTDGTNNSGSVQVTVQDTTTPSNTGSAGNSGGGGGGGSQHPAFLLALLLIAGFKWRMRAQGLSIPLPPSGQQPYAAK